jgi:serine/threonine-protein kinase ULK/ATG1
MKDSTYKIADFGFAKQLESEGDVLQSVAGTPLYMAPQVLLRLPYTSKCDIWSIGIILYELATQKAPYTA